VYGTRIVCGTIASKRLRYRLQTDILMIQNSDKIKGNNNETVNQEVLPLDLQY
jgi:hypothetical protein